MFFFSIHLGYGLSIVGSYHLMFSVTFLVDCTSRVSFNPIAMSRLADILSHSLKVPFNVQ